MRSENGIRDGGKRSPLKLDKDMVLAEKIKDLIADKNYGTYAIIQTFKNSSWPGETRICEKTLYHCIDGDVIHGISTKNFPNNDKKYNENKRKPKFSRVGCAIRASQTDPNT